MPNCERCGVAARGAKGNPDARMMRHAEKGVCVNCGTVLFLKDLEELHGGRLLPPGTTWREALALPHIQEQFGRLMRVGKADAQPDEIDWERVAQLWDLEPGREPGGLF